jgi:bacillithiol system protein YtxJ
MVAALLSLQTLEDLDQALAESRRRPVLFFKHSPRCDASAAAYDELLQYVASAADDVTRYLLLIPDARPASDALVARFGIRHESPQAILVRDGRAVWDAAHGAINQSSLAAHHA